MSISHVGVVDVLLEAARLKALDRAGWVRCGIPRPESVAAHSWGVSWLVLALLPEDLDSGRALSYAVLHDLPEVRVGDLVPSDKVDATAKSHREHAAMAALCRDLPGGERLLAIWEAYETQADPEARFVRQLDRLDMALQAVAYQEEHDTNLSEFLDSAAQVIDHPALAPLLEELAARHG